MKLLEFPHSHYCEAARWALDRKDVSYERTPVQPGLHLYQIKRIAPQSSLPVLINGTEIIQGSREIIDYCDANFDGPSLMPGDSSEVERVGAIEAQADENIGIPLRAIIYNRLLDDRKSVQHCFMQGSPAYKHWLFRATYPVLSRVIRDRYVPSQEYIDKAIEKFENQITLLDGMVEGRDFLIGERMTRADVMVASMLSLIVLPDEHPCDWPKLTDPEIISFRNRYVERPAFKWVRRMYAEHRV